MIHQDQIDHQIKNIQTQIADAFEMFNVHASSFSFSVALLIILQFVSHIDRDKFQNDVRRAQRNDHAELVQKIEHLSANDQRILDAIQVQGGVQRRVEELLVAVFKVGLLIIWSIRPHQALIWDSVLRASVARRRTLHGQTFFEVLAVLCSACLKAVHK